MPGLEVAADLVDVERLLGHEDLGRPAGDAGVGGDPAGVAAHDLADDDPIVRLGGGVQPVDGLGGDLHRGVEAEGDLGGGQVVVDGLGHTDDRDPLAAQPVGHAEGVLAADGDQGVDALCAQGLQRPVHAAVDLVGIGPRRPEDGPAPGQDAPAALDVERHGPVLDHAPPAVQEADELVAVAHFALAHDGPDHRVEAGAVAATGEHTNPHLRSPHRFDCRSPRLLARAPDATPRVVGRSLPHPAPAWARSP